MKKTFILSAPAKINLFLHIIGQREDGYHELQTIFQLLDYGDTISFSLRHDGLIKVSTQLPIPLEENLIYRIAKHLKEISQTEYGVTIVCHKKIPLGGGLGGGSSNAATVLHGLNQLWDLGLSTEELAEIGLAFGADVPVFVWGESAWGEGIGERLQPVDLPQGYYLILVPDVSVSTAELFSHPQLKRNYVPVHLENWQNENTENAFLNLLLKDYPEVEQAFDWLNQFSEAKLTGTGSALFAYFENKNEAENILKKIPENWHGFVARTLMKSPIWDELDF